MHVIQQKYTPLIMSLIVAIVGVVSIPQKLFAHVRYIATDAEILQYRGSDLSEFLKPLTEPRYLLLMIIILILVLGVYFFLSNAQKLQH
ncbi:MAG: hypothetical protein ACI83D_000735 [Planctomycetota bacterium]